MNRPVCKRNLVAQAITAAIATTLLLAACGDDPSPPTVKDEYVDTGTWREYTDPKTGFTFLLHRQHLPTDYGRQHMREVQGDLFDAPEMAIGHGVNCQGLMGAGIAAKFKSEYPEMHESYKIHCESGALVPGGVFIYKGRDGKTIVNLATQNLPGADARYDWLTVSFTKAIEQLFDLGITKLAIPRIGCGIGGLDWEAVRMILLILESATNELEPGFNFEIVIYTPGEPS